MAYRAGQRSAVLGSCTKRLAQAELEAMREERRRAVAAATARWEAEHCLTTA